MALLAVAGCSRPTTTRADTAKDLAREAGLTDKQMDAIFRQGVVSGTANACGLDWTSLSFTPLMAYWRSKGKTEPQMAVIAAWHGAGQGVTEARFKKQSCTGKTRRDVRALLPFQP